MSKSKHDEQGEDGPLQAKPQTFSQQVLVWVLVVAVGVLFGMGPALAILQGPGPQQMASVSQTEAVEHKNILSRLDGLLGQGQRPRGDWGVYAEHIYTARRAEAQGLMPKGETLDRIVDEFLARELSGDGQTVGQRLAEYEKSDRGVKAHELKRVLRIETAARNLRSRHMVLPVVPSTVIADLKALEGDRVMLAEASLSPTVLAPEFQAAAAADDATIRALYEELKDRWFRIPASSIVTVFAADPVAITPHVVVSDEEIEAYYEAQKELRPDWMVSDEAEDDPATEEADAAAEPEEPTYQPLEEVREQIVGELREQHAKDLARTLYDAFSTAIRRRLAELGIQNPAELQRQDLMTIAEANTIGPATHGELLDAPVGIVIREDVAVNEPEDGKTARLGEYGEVGFAGELFGEDAVIGTIDLPVTETEGLGLLLRLEATRPGSYRELDQVRDEVVAYHAGRLAWPTLLERAREIAATAQDMGADALTTHFAPEEVRQRWGTTVETREVEPLTEFAAPPADVDGVPLETWPAIAMATNQRPVKLAFQPGQGETLVASLPGVRLVQVTGYDSAGASYQGVDPALARWGIQRPKPTEDWLNDYRGTLGRHLSYRFRMDIQDAMREE